MGTSIATFKLTCNFLQFHASGAGKPLSAKCARAGKLGSSSCGMISSLIISFSPCISCGGPWVGPIDGSHQGVPLDGSPPILHPMSG